MFGSPQNLLLFRALLFASYPVVAVQGMLRHRWVQVDRETLRAPSLADCYLATPFVLAESVAINLSEACGTAVTTA